MMKAFQKSGRAIFIVPMVALVTVIVLFLVYGVLFKESYTDTDTDTDTKMVPHLSEKDMAMFFKYLDNASVYFEFGSGGSTYEASKRSNIRKIYSVESDKAWHDKLRKRINHTDIVYMLTDMDSKNNWGYAGPKSTLAERKSYSDSIRSIETDKAKYIDLVFIDGRFRVACCLKCFNAVGPDCFIAFDDFLDRKYYHAVLDYFDIVEKTSDERMVILKKKKNVSVPEELIATYEKDQR